ncbi:MAG: hypothetical protein AAFQ54_11765 [Pseudomonadota bacterium]
MSRLVIHIGTHKTATTSIQRFLKNNQGVLAERGVYYPDYSLIGKTPHYAHLGMVNALSGQHRVYTSREAEKFFGKVVERSKDFDTTIISGEPFYRHVGEGSYDRVPTNRDEYWESRRAYVARLRQLFGAAEIVVVFRRQADYAQSLYQEHVKVTRYKKNFLKFLEEFWYHFAFNAQATLWDEYFPGLRALEFDRLTRGGDAVREFCRLLALPISGLSAAETYNESLPPDLVVIKRVLHRTRASKDDLRDQMQRMLKALPETSFARISPRSFFASNADQLEFQKSFDFDNEELKRFMHADDDSNAPFFSSDFKKVKFYGDRLHPDILGSLVDMAIGPTAKL